MEFCHAVPTIVRMANYLFGKMKGKQQPSIYSRITEQFIKALHDGAPPWIRPWSMQSSSCGHPTNAISGRKYTGINVPILWSVANTRKYESDRWLTFRQTAKIRAKIRRGQKGTLVILYRRVQLPKQDANGDALLMPNGEPIMSTIKLVKGFTLFNIAQCENLPEKYRNLEHEDASETHWDPHAAAENLLVKSGASVKHSGNTAFYSPKKDQICLPPRKSFCSTGGYYSTILHELAHWTGHKSRLNRPGITKVLKPTSPEYAFEELIAEISTAFLCAELGIPGELRHEGYILAWIKALESDPRAIFKASSHATQAVKYLNELTGTANRDQSDRDLSGRD